MILKISKFKMTLQELVYLSLFNVANKNPTIKIRIKIIFLI